MKTGINPAEQKLPDDGWEAASEVNVRIKKNKKGKMDYMWIGIAAMGFIFALAALNKVTKLEKKLKESGVLQENWDKES